MTIRSWRVACVMAMALSTGVSFAQDAKALRDQANVEPVQEKQVLLLCKAADLEAKNAGFRHDCDVARGALITSDRQALKTALDAADKNNIVRARRYAGYVSSIDPETRAEADQLLKKLNGDAPSAATPATPVQPVPPLPSQNQTPSQVSLMEKAQSAFDAGNLAASRTTAQGITDPSLKAQVAHLLAQIDAYGNDVSQGQRHEKANEYLEAERAYRAALQLNPHVAADDLNARADRMRKLGSAIVIKKPSEPSPEERKKRLLDESAAAMARNDLDTAGRKYKQVLDLDTSNAEAKKGLADITAVLKRDPARLEKTLRDAIVAFYSSRFEDAELRLNRYLGAEGGRKKGAAFFYLGATEVTLALLEDESRRASRNREAEDDFKQARLAGYQPLDHFVSARVLGVWKTAGM